MHAQTDRHRLRHTHASAQRTAVHRPHDMKRICFGTWLNTRTFVRLCHWQRRLGFDTIRWWSVTSICVRLLFVIALQTNTPESRTDIYWNCSETISNWHEVGVVWCGVACACAMHSVGTCTAATFVYRWYWLKWYCTWLTQQWLQRQNMKATIVIVNTQQWVV